MPHRLNGGSRQDEIAQDLVSVFMPVRDHADYVGEMLDSVLGQTHEQLEVVLVECGSTDGTAEIIARRQRLDPRRLRVLWLDHDPGFARARNLAFSLTRGQFLCWMDSDDIWATEKVELQVELLRSRPDVGLVYSHFDAFDSGSGAILEWDAARCDLQGDLLLKLFTEGCFIASQTTMFRREAVMPALEKARRGEIAFLDDYELWMRIALDWRVALIPKVLMRYRRHDRNLSSRLTESEDPYELLMGMQRHLLSTESRARSAIGNVRFHARAEFLRRAAWAEPRLARKAALAARSAGNGIAGAVTAPPQARELRVASRSPPLEPS